MSRVLRTFREMIGLVSRGDFSRHLDAEMEKCLVALEECPADKCRAEMTVKVVFEYELGRIDTKVDAKIKLPNTAKFMKTPFWVVDGMLSLEHPNQIDMFPARSAPGDGEAASA